jgi:hypothetical protein
MRIQQQSLSLRASHRPIFGDSSSFLFAPLAMDVHAVWEDTVQVCSMINRGNSQGRINESLHKAAKDESRVKELIERGADPFAVTTDGETALSRGNAKTAILMARVPFSPMFRGCESLHDFFCALFPPVTEVSNNYKLPAWMPKIPFFSGENEAYFSTAKIFSLAHDLVRLLPKGFGLDDLLKLLLKAPFFVKVWDAAKRPELREVSDDYFVDANGKREFAAGQGADYNTDKHLISINKDSIPVIKLQNLLFEALNAVQKERFLAFDKCARAGKLGREDYVIIIERIEYDTQVWYNKLLHLFGYVSQADKGFAACWKRVQVPFIKDGVSHADEYREVWDLAYGAAFLRENPDILERIRASSRNPPRKGPGRPAFALCRTLTPGHPLPQQSLSFC